ncbi:MAG: adenylate/guanylate cyclase domain-containing protein [Chitinophagales bacterium]
MKAIKSAEELLAKARSELLSKPEKSKAICEQLLDVERNISASQKGEAQRLLGIVANMHGSTIKALRHFTLALENFVAVADQNGMAAAYTGLGAAYFLRLEYPVAIKHFLKARSIWNNTKNHKGEAGILINLANCYQRMSAYQQASQAFLKAFQLAKKTQDDSLLSNCSIAFSSFLLLRKRYREALRYLKPAYAIKIKSGDEVSLVAVHNNYGLALMGAGKFIPAQKHFSQALHLSSKHQLKAENIRAYLNLGELFMKLNETEEAHLHFTEVLRETRSEKFREQRMLAYRRLSELYELIGAHKKALHAFRKFYWQQHLLIRKENIREMNRFQSNFMLEKKEREKEIFKLRNVDLKNVLKRLDDEKKQTEKLLLNILPAEIAADLKSRGSSAVKKLEEVTVVFADIKGFTKLSELYEPEELVAELDFCFRHFDSIMDKHGLEKIKTIGDAYMCACGVPKPRPGHALKAVRAAIEMNQFILKRKKERERSGRFAFELRIGINSGPVIAGIIGERKFAYDIWGDTVNTAARMEQKSEAGQINISESTFEKVKRHFKCTYRGEIDAKNKGKLKMFFVNDSL